MKHSRPPASGVVVPPSVSVMTCGSSTAVDRSFKRCASRSIDRCGCLWRKKSKGVAPVDDAQKTPVGRTSTRIEIMIPIDARLDAQVRDWVLLPIFIAMYAVGCVRHHVSRALNASETSDKARDEVKNEITDGNLATRADRLASFCGYLRPRSFLSRLNYLCDDERGKLSETRGSDTSKKAMEMMSDPTKATAMMSKSLINIVPQMVTGAWVNFFFTGFVVGRVPFPLTASFRGMLQRGVALRGLDVTYVSSLSWYFLNLFGLGGVFRLTLGANEEETDPMAGRQAMMGAMGANADRAFAQIKERLAATKHEHTIWRADARATAILSALCEGKSEIEARRVALKK